MENYSLQLTEQDITSGYTNPTYTLNSLNYNLSISTYLDFVDLRTQLADYIINHESTPAINTLLNTSFPSILAKQYSINVRAKYILPGKNIQTSSSIINLLN